MNAFRLCIGLLVAWTGLIGQAQTAHFSYSLRSLNSISSPKALAVDGAGNVYVTNGTALEEFLASAGYSTTQDLTPSGLYGFTGIAVDAGQDIYLADQPDAGIRMLPPGCVSYTCATSYSLSGNYNTPQGLTFSGGKVLFAFQTSVDELLGQTGGWAGFTSLANGFQNAVAIAATGTTAGSKVIVVDAGVNTVYQVTLGCSPTCIKTLAIFGASEPLHGVALDGALNVWVTAGDNVYELLAAASYDSLNTYQGFNAPTGLAFDNNGNLFVADTGNNRVVEFEFKGGDLGAVPIGQTGSMSLTFTFDGGGVIGSPGAVMQGIAGLDFGLTSSSTCSAGTNYVVGSTCTVNATFTPSVSGPRNGAVFLRDHSGNAIASANVHGVGLGPQLSFLHGQQSTLGGGFSGLTGVAVDGNGNVLVADTLNKAVKEIPPGCADSGCVGLLGGGFGNVAGIAVDGRGNVIVSDTGSGSVKEIPPGCRDASCVNILTQGISPSGIAVDGNGDIFVTDTIGNSVLELPFGCGCINTLTSGGSSSPSGIAVDANGNLYVTYLGSSKVLELFAPNYNYSWTQLGYGFNHPSGIAVDASGNVYVADTNNGLVREITADGFSTWTLGTGFNQPSGIALDGNGNVYVADAGNSNLTKLDLADPPSLFFATPTPVGSTDTTDGPEGVTAQNIGNATLTFQPFVSANLVDVTLASAGQYDCTGLPNLQLSSRAFCNIEIQLSPQQAGLVNGNLSIIDNALNAAPPQYSIQTIPVHGTGTPGSQTISFPSPGATTFGSVITLAATSSSGLGVTYQVIAGPATLTGNLLSVIGVGTIIVQAWQPGNSNYAAATPVSVSFTANPAAPMITWAAPAAITYGTPLSATQLNATASVPGTFVYSPALGTVLGAGTQTLSVTFTPTDSADYTTATKPVLLIVNKAVPVISWATPAVITYGTALSATQLNATASVPGTFVYSPALGTVLGAGTQTLSVTFTPTDSTDYGTTTKTNSLAVNKASPTLSLSSSPTTSTYGSYVTFTANMSTGPSGNVAFYDGAKEFAQSTLGGTQAQFSWSTLTAGVHTITATWPGDINYNSVTSAPIIETVVQASSSITWAAPAAITYGTPLSATQLNATASVPGTFVYSPALGTVLGAGTQTLSVTFTPTDSADYTTATKPVLLIVNKAVPVISWATPAAITYGTALSAVQLNASSGSVVGTLTYNPTSGTILTAGSHQLAVTFTPTDGTDYSTATTTVNITVNQATPTLTWATPATIIYGTALTATQLNASSGSVTGTFTYSPGAGTVLTRGTRTLSVTFMPTDATDYSTAMASVKITVNPATLTVTASSATLSYGAPVPTPTPSYAGWQNGDSANSLTTPPVCSTTYTVTSHPGSYPTSCSGAADPNYSFNYVSGTITASPATPSLTWTAPTAITYGTALSAAQLNASSGSVTGMFDYNPTAGTILAAGTHQLSVSFTPTDGTDYGTATTTVNITVNKATPTLTWATPVAITYGTTISSTQLNASSGGVSGTFSYSPASGTVLTAGTHPLSVTFTPTDTTDYAATTTTVNITVNQATPTLTWATPSTINYGTALSAAQLNASSGSVVGTFTYNPGPGIILTAGTHQLSVSFTPADDTDYSTATTMVNITVNKATPTLQLTPSSSSISRTQALTVSITVASGNGTIVPTGTVAVTSGSFSSGAVALNNGSAMINIPAGSLSTGTDTLTATYTPDLAGSSDYTSASGVVSVSVAAPVKITPSISVSPASSSISTGQSLAVTVAVNGGTGNPVPSGTVALSSGTYVSAGTVLTNATAMVTIPAGSLAVGTDTLTVAYSPDVSSSSAYNSASGTASILVTNPSYSMKATSVTIAPGGSATSAITISSGNGYVGTVSLTCAITASPSGALDTPSCTASQSISLSSSSTSGTANVTVNSTAASSVLIWPKMSSGGAGSVFVALIVIPWLPRRRRTRTSLLVFLAVLILFSGLSACGGAGGGGKSTPPPSNPGTTPGTYTVTVTGIGNDTAKATASTTFTLTVN